MYRWLALLVIAFAVPAAAEPPAAPVPDTPPKIVLTDDQVTRYAAALDELAALGLDAERELGSNPTEVQQQAVGDVYSTKIRDVITRHGFDESSFTPVHWNAMLAYASILMEERQPEIDAAMERQRAELERLKASLPPEQYAAMMEGFGQMDAIQAAYRDVPPENKKLVAKHRATFDRVFEAAQSR